MKKGLLRGVFAFAAVLLLCTPSFATNWVRIGEGHYIDSDSIRPSSNYGTYTMLTKYIASGTRLEVVNVTSGRNVAKQWYGINNPGSIAYESYAFVCTDRYLNVRNGYDHLLYY